MYILLENFPLGNGHLFIFIGTFGDASRLHMSKNRYLLIVLSMNDARVVDVVKLFEVEMAPLDHDFNYLGFQLKPKNYGLKFWSCLI